MHVPRARTTRRLWIAAVMLAGGVTGIGTGLLLVRFLM